MNVTQRISNGWQSLWRKRMPRRSFSLLRTKPRFYESVSYKEIEGVFYIQLDGKTIKTPLKNQLYVPTKHLAMAVVSEWSSQRSTVKPNQMHLTALCNTCIDNPGRMSKDEVIESTLAYLHSDTLCLRIPSEESEVMSTLQQQKWNPVLDWFNKRFEVDVQWSTELFGLEQPKHTILKMSHVLSGLNKWQLTGLRFSIESLKSFIIPFAVIEKRLSLDDAIFLSRLEIQLQAFLFQYQSPGSISSASLSTSYPVGSTGNLSSHLISCRQMSMSVNRRLTDKNLSIKVQRQQSIDKSLQCDPNITLHVPTS